MRMSLIKKYLQNLMLALVATLFAVFLWLLFDITLGSFFVSEAKVDPIRFDKSGYVGSNGDWYELKPNYKGYDSFGHISFPMETSSWGFRKNPGSVEASVGNEVIFLGDSFTYGVNGPWDETFVGMYEKGSGKKVINAGVASYSPTPYLYQYKKAINNGLLSDGHSVVIGIDISDVQDEAGIWTDGTLHPVRVKMPPDLVSENIENSGTKTSKSIVAPKKERSRFVAARDWLTDRMPLTLKIYEFLKARGYIHLDQRLAPVLAYPRSAFTWQNWETLNLRPPHEGYAPLGVSGGLDRISNKVKDISKLAQEHNAKVYILIYPWPAQVVYKDAFSWSDYANQLCQKIQCAGVIDLVGEFRRLSTVDSNWYRNYYIIGDLHFNKEGNRIVSDALLANLPK